MDLQLAGIAVEAAHKRVGIVEHAQGAFINIKILARL
ncbi:hypothetical protein SDC9_175147 [bioreactor metagenome]|uniref:Uncharacterized protein n=1 Tax=bioreactor metagenome TaxID=1076179 RepID=A0A645GVQ2_9ZZZZ